MAMAHDDSYLACYNRKDNTALEKVPGKQLH